MSYYRRVYTGTVRIKKTRVVDGGSIVPFWSDPVQIADIEFAYDNNTKIGESTVLATKWDKDGELFDFSQLEGEVVRVVINAREYDHCQSPDPDGSNTLYFMSPNHYSDDSNYHSGVPQ